MQGGSGDPVVRAWAFLQLCRARDLLSDVQSPNVSIADAAREASLSSFHFIRAFHAAFEVTPHQYLRARRLDRAKELLVTTAYPVTEICDQIGFQSLGSFSSLFRRLTGKEDGLAALWNSRRRSGIRRLASAGSMASERDRRLQCLA